MKYLFTIFVTIFVCLIGVGLWNHFNHPGWLFLIVGLAICIGLGLAAFGIGD